ncbi:hypothetical protein LZQ00_11245 [Sphingobacterium sp. SRCM116780]|uniref:hypothetical protein n=1 Tax=Sphingobacterium sp. SRCM116780 TaxID=2907623 RepID=UPI001F299407|nr:hypothetical protein [Sphingobacterium sp. SRCM116780]UIR54853.1 hypothetical protein LZQ00_11245 [Sphingobacterium sp. SRCM116780]
MEIIISTALQSHFLRLYQMACSDENFDMLEMKLLYKFAENRGVSTERLNNILTNPIQQMELPESTEKRIEYLYDLAVMIWADKQVTLDEHNLLRKYCRTFEFLEENVEELCDYLIDCAKQQKQLHEVLDLMN